MKRKNHQEKVTPETLSSSSSSLIGHDGSGRRCLSNNPTNSVIKLAMANSRGRDRKSSIKSKGKNVSNSNKNEMSVSSLIKNAKSVDDNKERITLRAKRRCTSAESLMANGKQKNNEKTDVCKKSNDTLQMKLLKEKILLRQKAGNAPKKSKIIKDVEVKKKISTTEIDHQYTKSNNKLSKASNKSQIVTRKIKKELIAQGEEHDKFVKLHKVANVSKQIDKKCSVIDKKPKTIRHKENTISETNNKVSPVLQKRKADVLSNDSSLGLSISSSSANSPSLIKLTSKYIIPKKQDSQTNTNNNYSNNNKNNIDHNSTNEKNTSENLDKTNTPSSALKILKEASPSIYKNAEERMKALRERLEAQIASDKLLSSEGTNTSNLNNFCEEMEWEPIEEEIIIHEVQAVRAQLGVEENDVQMLELPYSNSNAELTTRINDANNDTVIYVVIDTNVLLSSIETIEKFRDISFKIYGKPIIIIPWTVIRELDFIKDDKLKTGSESLKFKARQAVRFLYHHFSIKHPQIKGQKFQDAVNNREKFATECPDDEILQTCLQIRSPHSIVVLLSFDKNLCNKAMIHEIITLGKDDSPEKIIHSLHKDKRRGPKKKSNIIDIKIKTEEDVLPISTSPVIQNEEPKLNVDDVYEEVIDILTAFLTVVVSCEMKNLYGDDWEKYTILKPPWTAIMVLKCAIKHWIAAVSDSFFRKADSILKELLQLIIKFENSKNKQLKDIKYIVELFNDLIQSVNDVNKYPSVLRKCSSTIEILRVKCTEKSKQLAAIENSNAEIINLTKEEEEKRANLAFKYFDKIYEFTRDFCGAISEIAGIPCSFQYNQSSPSLLLLNSEDIKKTSPDIAGNLNRLLQTLSVTLENINEICINHRCVTVLYQLLTNFLPNITEEFTHDQLFPADIFYCLKHKEEHLKCGVTQLLELSNHFSHIAQLTS